MKIFGNKMEGLEKYKRKAIFCHLKDYDFGAKEHGYIEITEWNNGEGVDINAYSHTDRTISITYGEFKLIKKLIKKLEK
jgi:hypothetical protein